MPEYDVYRDSPLRFLGYANELAEAFRPIVHKYTVYSGYGLATGYVIADIVEKTFKASRVPRSSEEWNKIITGFDTRWNFPNSTGAIDGKHVIIKCPNGTGSDFYNYKQSFSLVLLAVVDYDYCFAYINVGAKGRSSDGGIFNDCSLKKAIGGKSLNLPDNYVCGRRSISLKKLPSKTIPASR